MLVDSNIYFGKKMNPGRYEMLDGCRCVCDISDRVHREDLCVMTKIKGESKA